ncbi:phage tail assembly protein [Pontibacterium sp.]|jgi:hypothetical protein|uniref:phage tail assembly protein n=1 Tax=Pontibacterium sp. TaxID=2036026 RepID=UPI003565F9C0
MSAKVLLTSPLVRGEMEVSEIELREPKAGELRGLNNMDVLQMSVTAHRTLIPRISSVTANEFDQLAPADLIQLQQAVVSFFLPGDQ